MSAKKGTKKEAPETTYAVKDVVLGKVRGYTAWPAQVVDPDTVPQAVRRERPSGKTTSTYVVQFFPAGDYAWLTPKDISKLQKHEIEAYINEPHKPNKELLAGYRAALNPAEWEETRAAEVANAEEDDEEEEEGTGEVDELASGEEDSSRSKKRKKSVNSSSAAAGGSKKRKKDDSVSASAGGKGGKKRGSESTSAAASKKGGAKGGKKNGKSKAMVESEDEGGNAAEEEEPTRPTSKKASPPPTKKAKKDDGEETSDPEALKVREWRHKLQKTFLSNKGAPKESEMPAMDQLFTTIETYEKMDVFYLSFSKIGKVMRHIAALKDNQVPKDDKFRFRGRAKKLIDKWHVIIENSKEGKEVNGANGAPTTNGNHSPEQTAPTTNGTSSPKREQGTGLTGDMSMLGDVTMSEVGIDN